MILRLAIVLCLLMAPALSEAAQTFYKSVTLEESESGTADSTDFPLTFIGDSFLADTANGGKCVVGNSGYDVRFYEDSGLSSPLPFERVFWTNTTGAGEWHIKIPVLSATTDTVIYVACGDTALTTNGSSTSTWSTTFKGVYHLGDGATLSVNDSTSNANHGTNNGVVAGAGRVGGAGVFTSDYIDLGTQSEFSFSTAQPFTISAWFNSANAADNPQGIVTTYDRDNDSGSWGMSANIGPHRLVGVRPVPPFAVNGGTTISTATWYLATFMYDGTNLNLYLNGVSDATPLASGSLSATAKRTLIGAYVNTATQGNYFPGSLDEIRIENTGRTTSWITATYNNQKASSTFTTLGSLTVVSGGTPATPVLDTFNRTAEDPLTATNWEATGGSTNFKTNGTQVLAASIGSSETRWKTALVSSDQELYLTLVTPPVTGGEFWYLTYRGQSAALTDAYRMKFYQQGSRGVYLYKVISGVETLLDSTDIGGVWTAGDAMWVKVIDGTHTLYHNGVQVWQVVESGAPAIPAGQHIGFGTNPVAATIIVMDTFGGGSLGTGPPNFSTPRPTWFQYTQDYIAHEIDDFTANTFFTGASLWPPLTANTITKVGNNTAKDLEVFYPGAVTPCLDFKNTFGFLPCLESDITTFATTIANLAAARLASSGSPLGVWWHIAPEYDGLGGHHIKVAGHPFTSGTRAGMYTNYLAYVDANWEPMWTMLQTPQAARDNWLMIGTVWNANTHYSYEWGADLVMLERMIDELGDLATGTAFIRGAAAQYNKPWGIDNALFRSSAAGGSPDRGVTEFSQATGLQLGGWSTSYTKRHLYLTYMAGANKMFSESLTFRYPDTTLNPAGLTFKAFGEFTVAHPTRGAAVVPIAFLMDHDHGFVPRHWVYSDVPLSAKHVWYQQLPYNAGDHATNNLFVHLWPNHWKHGQTMGWNGGTTVVDSDFAAFGAWIAAGNDPRPYEPMPTSTYGDMFDVLLSNTTLPALNRYQVVWPIGNFAMTPTLNTMFSDYATTGGIVVLNATQVTAADETLLGVTLGSTTTSTASKWGTEANLTEATFTYRIVTPTTATVIATNPNTGAPLITKRVVGTGAIYFFAGNYMQDDANAALLNISTRLLGDLTVTYRKGWVTGSAVDFITTQTPTGLTVTVANNSGSIWNGTVHMKIGTPVAAAEWLTSTTPSYVADNGVTNVTASVPAYDVRIFSVTGDEAQQGGAPSAPTGLRFVGTQSGTGAVFAWNPNPEANIAGYKVYRDPIPGQPTTLLTTITPASAAASHSSMTLYRDRLPVAGTRYYTVTAFTTGNEESEPATEIGLTVTGMVARAIRVPTP